MRALDYRYCTFGVFHWVPPPLGHLKAPRCHLGRARNHTACATSGISCLKKRTIVASRLCLGLPHAHESAGFFLFCAVRDGSGMISIASV